MRLLIEPSPLPLAVKELKQDLRIRLSRTLRSARPSRCRTSHGPCRPSSFRSQRAIAPQHRRKGRAVPQTVSQPHGCVPDLMRRRDERYIRLRAPAAANEWRAGVCEKPHIKCSDCAHRVVPPLTDAIIYKRLAGEKGGLGFHG